MTARPTRGDPNRVLERTKKHTTALIVLLNLYSFLLPVLAAVGAKTVCQFFCFALGHNRGNDAVNRFFADLEDICWFREEVRKHVTRDLSIAS